MASPIAGNESFTNVENLVVQVPVLDVNELNVANLLTENSTVTAETRISALKPSLEGLAVATLATGGAVTYAAGVSVNNFTGGAAQAGTLPSATVGSVVVHYQSADTTGGTATLTFSCATNESFATGSNILTTAGAAVIPATPSVAGDNTLTFTPANATTNILTIGCMIYFTCTQAGIWHVNSDLSGTHAQVTGTFAFSTV